MSWYKHISRDESAEDPGGGGGGRRLLLCYTFVLYQMRPLSIIWHEFEQSQAEDVSETCIYSTRISGHFAPFILVGSALCLGPPALGMDRVEQVVGVGVAVI